MSQHTAIFHTIALARKLQKVIGFKSPPINLTYSQASAILVISSAEAINQKEIAQSLHLEPASVVTLIDDLENTGLVKRQSADGDRRRYQIVLTAKGKKSAQAVKLLSKNLENFLKSKVTQRNYDTFFATVSTLHQALDTWQKEK